MRRFAPLSLLIALIPLPGCSLVGEPEVSVVKLKDFEKAVQSHRGKVVVVYFWADYSVPDKKILSEFVALSQRWKDRPVVFMTLCDGQTGPEEVPKVRKTLQRYKASSQNFILDDDPEVWQKAFRTETTATIFIYDRQGDKADRIDIGEENLIGRAENALKVVAESLR